jgi:hypothetical protein
MEQDNPFVKKHDTVIKNLANLIKLEKQEQQKNKKRSENSDRFFIFISNLL